MKQEIIDYYYKQLIDGEERELQSLEEYKQVNSYLKSNDWLFISPIFFQGYELEHFLKLSKSQKDEKETILKVIHKKFYNLNYTASFIEGYCSRATYIRPFLMSIEHSLILCFQKDYEGSIKTIIPIIEGILRKYLITEKGYSNETIRSKDLKNSFEKMKLDLINDYKIFLAPYQIDNNVEIKFSDNQFNDLVARKCQYFDVWFSFVSDFVDKSFYLKTSGKTLTNEVNRHSILHEFGFDFEYNFENYIKIFFLLQFLTWIFLMKEGKSILNNIETLRFAEKIYAYEKIIQTSESLLYDKHILYKNYDNYKEDILKQEFPTYKNDLLPKKHHLAYKLFRNIRKLMWRKDIEAP